MCSIGDMQDLFASVDAALNSGSPAEALEMLAREFHQRGCYDLLFEARGMAKRLELGLPLIQTESSTSFPDGVRPAYEETVIAAAREAGDLACIQSESRGPGNRAATRFSWGSGLREAS